MIDEVVVGYRFDDGQDVIGNVYFIVMEISDGTRYRHFHTWVNKVQKVDEETGEPYFEDLTEKVESEMFKLLGKMIEVYLVEKRRIDMRYWEEMEPVYGSEAYCKRYGF